MHYQSLSKVGCEIASGLGDRAKAREGSGGGGKRMHGTTKDPPLALI